MNLKLLTVLMMRTGLAAHDLCSITGYSRAYLSKCLKGTITPSEGFWSKLNSALAGGKLDSFLGQLFQVETAPPSKVIEVLSGLR
ncbi:MAG: hypothetical protein K8T26_01565 [Lentisphaerae bacterium]|nr:hypothetical protein [Lentisphaerota bacterium]